MHLRRFSGSSSVAFRLSNMKGVSILFFLGVSINWGCAQFLNNRPFPTYSLENMPKTDFTCREKILGGYYADAETNCQMFHICVKVAGVGVQDFRFLCPNGTAFDQDHQICAEWEDIDCDASTLYYSSDNFDLYRIGSGFESKAQKYGEEEETFALQRAETGDARINREQQSHTVNQKKEFNTLKQQRNQYNNNYNSERDIFKSSSSSNFYNNRNNGKERDEDYDDNVNVNQNTDYSAKRKVVKNKIRRPVQNNDYNANNDEVNRNHNDYNTNQKEASTRRAVPARTTGFQNNFAGSSYIPTTARTTTTTINADQYTTAVHNYRTRNGQRQRQTDSSVYTISTPAPFRGSQQYNPAPSRQANSGRYYSTTENYPQSVPKVKQSASTSADQSFNTNYDVPRTSSSASQTFNTQFDTPKVKQSASTAAAQTYNTNYDVPRTSSSASQTFNTQFDTPKVKQSASTAAAQTYNTNYDIPRTSSSSSQTFNTQFDTPKVKQSGSTTAQTYNTNYDIPRTKQPSTGQTYNTKLDSTTNQYESTKLKTTDNYPNKYNAFEKKSTTPLRQTENYPSTLSPKPFSVSGFPSTFAPRTNNAYNQIAHQSINYKKGDGTAQTSLGSSQQSSTVKSTGFSQYTPTVPRISPTTPASRSSRFDETQYDDGSYSTKYDYDDKREDEFLKTAHSQNIAASRNELSRTTKAQPQRSDAPRPFSKVTEAPRVGTEASTKAAEHKAKDVSYDYAYYDSHTDSGEADYDIETDIKKSTTKN